MLICILLAQMDSVFLSSRRRHTRSKRDWSSDVCSSDLREYKSFKGNLSLLEFLNNSVKNKDKFLQYINLLDKKTDKLKGEFEGNDGRYFSCTYCKLIIDDNEVGFVCYIEDITYKKKSEMKIKDNKMKYKKIVDNIPY